MKRYNIIDLMDEREFRYKVMTDLPESHGIQTYTIRTAHIISM